MPLKGTTALPPWAHSGTDESDGHLLVDHLRGVAELAGTMFAAESPTGALAHLAGLWHDLGKYRAGFQRYIRMAGGAEAHIEGKLPASSDKTHSAAGALWARSYLQEHHGKQGTLIARALEYVIAGHHSGLDNWYGGLEARLAGEDARRELDDALGGQPPSVVLQPALRLPEIRQLPVTPAEKIPGRFALWLRMLFSALVDADFLDTEAFMNPAATAKRQGGFPAMPELLHCFDAYMARLAEALAASGQAQSTVNLHRDAVLAACRKKAQRPPGTFTLTVPTGGGKTLAALAFALTHAVQNNKRRVVFAIPYTSIIEQTAEVYREVFAALGDPDIVLEHHSNAEPGDAAETARSRLACENWDAPVVVTTNVQFFESLFARKTSRCRKLHNLTDAVVVLDEAQLLPVQFLQPVVDVLRLLVLDHGVTVVLCTATQPVLSEQRRFGGQGLRGYATGEVTAIIDDDAALYRALKRVRVKVPTDLTMGQPWEKSALEIAQNDAVLAVVGRRADATTLFNVLRAELGQEGLWHLSGLMCPQHRSEVIADIKKALWSRRQEIAQGRRGAPVRVISTQLVEAGVDLDFPVVFRALGGLDSIAQAAGRCNREGQLALGEVQIFVPPKAPPPGLLRIAAQACAAGWDGLGADDDPLDLALIERYFSRLYADVHSLDAECIGAALKLELDNLTGALAVRFKDAAEAFKLIDDEAGATVFVRWHSDRCREDVNALIGLLERDGPDRWLMRKLQRYGVTIYQHDLKRLLASGDVREIAAGIYVQAESDIFYDPVLGARLDGAPGDPGNFFI